MKTIVDHAKSTYTNTIINQKAEQYSKDAGFKIITCRSFRPRTKGKVETLAKIMDRLNAFDYEFEDKNELENIVKKLMNELNFLEKSQATNEIPKMRFDDEKKYLIPVNHNLLKSYTQPTKLYKVSHESMITYQGIKYSVPIRYVDKYLSVLEDDEIISIYNITEFICSYKKNSNFRYNYKESDYINILKYSAFNEKTESEINDFINHNLSSLDGINIEKEEQK